jgi:hypothetical protein
MPVDGLMFCLQCGNAVAMGAKTDRAGPELEDTTDPLLRKAIVDGARHPVKFRLPISGSAPVKQLAPMVSVKAFVSAAPASAQPAGGMLPAMPVPGVELAQPVAAQDLPAAPKLEASGTRIALGPWLAGISAFVLFMLVNVAVYAAFANRVYPGVRVGNVNLGGVKFSDVRAKLSAALLPAKLTVNVGSVTYSIKQSDLGSYNLDVEEREARAQGHTTPLPLAGIVEAYFSKPIQASFQTHNEAILKQAELISTENSRAPAQAVPVIDSGRAFIIEENAGVKLDQVSVLRTLKQAVGTRGSVSIQPVEVKAQVTADSFKQDLEQAQTKLGAHIQVKVGSKTYAPTPSEIGSWLAFAGPGKGVTVDSGMVGKYVAGMAGNFDKQATVQAIVTAQNAGEDLSYVAAPKVTNITVAASSQHLPLYSYTYCAKGYNDKSTGELKAQAASNFADPNGWNIGGRLKFSLQANSCMFYLRLAPQKDIAGVGPECEKQTTCLSGSTLIIAAESWSDAPGGWKGGLAAYRAELINHEVGHWLGFEHASCSQATAKPILEAPTVILGGCSPQWYQLPAETQSAKPLPGFSFVGSAIRRLG